MTKSRNIAPPRRGWTDAEVQAMLRDYPHRPTWQLAQELGRPERHLYNKAKNLGLRKTPEYLSSELGGRLRRGSQVGAPWLFKPGHTTTTHLNRVGKFERPRMGRIRRPLTDANTTAAPAVGSPLDCGVGRLEPERASFLAQIEACRREVAQWPAWMRQERDAPAWMLGWDD